MTTPPPGNPMDPIPGSVPPQGNVPYPPQGGAPFPNQGGQHPGGQYQGGQYAGGQYPGGQYPPQGGQYPPMPQAPAVKEKNTVGLVALIAAIVGLIFACIPGALIIGWILLPIAFILGIVGLVQSGKAKGTSIGALVVAVIGTIVGFTVFFVVVTDAVDEAFSGSDLVATAPESGSNGGSASSGGTSNDGSRENPLPIGQTVTNDEWAITLGQPREAWAEVSAENQFNEAPKAGMEFWIVPITATYTGDTTGLAWIETDVKFVGSDNKTYSDRCGVIPDDLSDIDDLYPGGVAEGNVCVAVPAGADGLWAVSTGFAGSPSFFTTG